MKTAQLYRNLLFCSVALALNAPVSALARQAEGRAKTVLLTVDAGDDLPSLGEPP